MRASTGTWPDIGGCRNRKLLQELTPHVDDPLCLHLESLRDLWYCVVTMIVMFLVFLSASHSVYTTDDGD